MGQWACIPAQVREITSGLVVLEENQKNKFNSIEFYTERDIEQAMREMIIFFSYLE